MKIRRADKAQLVTRAAQLQGFEPRLVCECRQFLLETVQHTVPDLGGGGQFGIRRSDGLTPGSQGIWGVWGRSEEVEVGRSVGQGAVNHIHPRVRKVGICESTLLFPDDSVRRDRVLGAYEPLFQSVNAFADEGFPIRTSCTFVVPFMCRWRYPAPFEISILLKNATPTFFCQIFSEGKNSTGEPLNPVPWEP